MGLFSARTQRSRQRKVRLALPRLHWHQVFPVPRRVATPRRRHSDRHGNAWVGCSPWSCRRQVVLLWCCNRLLESSEETPGSLWERLETSSGGRGRTLVVRRCNFRLWRSETCSATAHPSFYFLSFFPHILPCFKRLQSSSVSGARARLLCSRCPQKLLKMNHSA